MKKKVIYKSTFHKEKSTYLISSSYDVEGSIVIETDSLASAGTVTVSAPSSSGTGGTVCVVIFTLGPIVTVFADTLTTYVEAGRKPVILNYNSLLMIITYSMVQQPLKSFDHPLIRVLYLIRF